jgi:hypothetical protein
MGTLAYGVWFNQDQRVYAEAMEHARQTLWLAAPVPVPTPAVRQTASPDDVAAPAAAAGPVTVASADLNGPVPSAQLASAQLDRRAAPPDSAAPKLAVARSVRATCPASVERHRPVPRVKSNGNVLTRVGSFFHRVSYRQHGTESQRDIYAHP